MDKRYKSRSNSQEIGKDSYLEMDDIENIKSKLKELLLPYFVDVTPEEMDVFIDQNYDTIKNWKVEDLDEILTHFKH